ncbi:MAG: tetratricopeptide repeat protein [Candidatus Edwardsbacteria bacterium]|nr:tetratricopeptide repeat protein [Candidatus Edwardsbacteria bacterium]
MNPRRLRLLAGATIILAGLAVYANTFHSPFVFDDDTSIVQNNAIRPPLDIGNIWSHQPTRFVGNLSFALNYRFGQLRVEGYHAVNLGIHLLAGLAVYWLILLLFKTPALRDSGISDRRKQWLAFFGSLVFVMHPIQTQAVTYVVQRFASLAALFYICCAACYAAFRLSVNANKRLWLVLSLVSGASAMMTKENAFSLPALILLFEIFFFRPRQVDLRRLALVLSALILIAGLSAALDLLPRETSAITRTQYLCTQFRVMLTYMRLLIAPVGQNVDYDYPVYSSLANPAALAGLAVTGALIVFSIFAGKRYPLLSFAVIWLFTALSVESSLIPISDVIFEHRLYLPMAGFALFFVGLLVYFGNRFRARLVVIAASGLILCYGVSTYARNELWRTKLRIVNDTVAKSPGKARPLDYRGNYFASIGQPDKALADYAGAIALNPAYWKAYYNRGTLLALAGRNAEALPDLNRAIALQPDYRPACVNKANVLNRPGSLDSAIWYYDRAIALDSADGNAYGSRGLAYVRKGEIDQGLADYDRALRLDPELTYVHLNRGLALNLSGKYEWSVSELDKYLSVSPASGDALIGRAWALYKLGRYGEARRDLERAAALRLALPKEYREMERILRYKNLTP